MGAGGHRSPRGARSSWSVRISRGICFLRVREGGAFLLGSFVDFALRVSNRSWLRGASAVTDAGLLAGPVLVALGTVFLALDLGAPDQAFRLFLTPSGSLLSAGAWALALFCATAFAAFLMGFSDDGPVCALPKPWSVSSPLCWLCSWCCMPACFSRSIRPCRFSTHRLCRSCSSRRRWQPELPC